MTVTKNGDNGVLDFTPLMTELVERTDNALEKIITFEKFFGNTTTIEVERVTDGHDVIQASERGGDRNYVGRESAQLETFRVPFFTLDGYTKASEVQDFRAYLTAGTPETTKNRVDRKLARIQRSHDKHLRAAMYAALGGNTYAPGQAGSQYVVNYATKWGVTADVATVDIDFTDVNVIPTLKVEKEGVTHIREQAQDDAGSYNNLALVGSGIFNSFQYHPETQAAFSQYQSTQEPLRDRLSGNRVGREFFFSGILYIEDVSGLIAVDKGYLFPDDIADMWQIHYSPSDAVEDANEVAQAIYLWMDNGRRKKTIESETSFVILNTRPELVVKLTATLLPGA